METETTEFWNCFLSMHIDLIFANNVRDFDLEEVLFDRLLMQVAVVHPELELIIVYKINGGETAKLVFLTKGNYKLLPIINRIVKDAPQLDLWDFEIGIKPYKHSVLSLCEEHRFLGPNTTIFQIYFSVQKIYKSSNKLHLLLYVEMDKRHSKVDIHGAMYGILLYFLGDTFYHRHISRYKIVRRKYSKIGFIPLDELKNVIQYKFLN